MNRLMYVVLGVSIALLQACTSLASLQSGTAQYARADMPSDERIEPITITSALNASTRAAIAPAAIAPELIEYQPEPYRIGVGDALFITVWDHPELTIPGGSQTNAANARIVGDDGTLFYPFIGKIRAEGLKPDQLRSALTNQLSRFIDQPQIDVSVLEHNSQKVLLTGAFVRPGFLTVTSRPLSLLEAVGSARIDKAKADPSQLLLIRDGVTYSLDYNRLITDLSSVDEVYLRAGDRLHLPSTRQGKVYVLGDIEAPHSLPYNGDQMMLSAVLDSFESSLSRPFRARHLYIIRDAADTSDDKMIFQLNAQEPNAYLLADHFRLQPRDVIYVGSPKIDDWAGVIHQLFPEVADSAAQSERVSAFE